MTKPANPSTEAPACESWCGAAACEFGCAKRVPAPQAIERCSCTEAIRLRAALEAIRRSLDSYRASLKSNAEVRGEIRDIARRALGTDQPSPPDADFMFACSFCGTREGATTSNGESIAGKLTVGPGVSICPSCAEMAAGVMSPKDSAAAETQMARSKLARDGLAVGGMAGGDGREGGDLSHA